MISVISKGIISSLKNKLNNLHVGKLIFSLITFYTLLTESRNWNSCLFISWFKVIVVILYYNNDILETMLLWLFYLYLVLELFIKYCKFNNAAEIE